MDRGEVLTWVLRIQRDLSAHSRGRRPLELVGMGGQAGDIPIYQINPEAPTSYLNSIRRNWI